MLIICAIGMSAFTQNKTEYISGVLLVKLKQTHRTFFDSPESALSEDGFNEVLGLKRLFP